MEKQLNDYNDAYNIAIFMENTFNIIKAKTGGKMTTFLAKYTDGENPIIQFGCPNNTGGSFEDRYTHLFDTLYINTNMHLFVVLFRCTIDNNIANRIKTFLVYYNSKERVIKISMNKIVSYDKVLLYNKYQLV